MKAAMILVFSMFVLNGFAQSSGIETYRYERKPFNNLSQRPERPKALPDSIKSMMQRKSNELSVKQYNRNDMPVLRQKLYGEYSHNNGKGSDVYAMKPYNMPCLVPDSTYNSNMPMPAYEQKGLPRVEFRRGNNNTTSKD